NKLAEAKVQGKPLVVSHVPPAYRLNHGRFLLVARQVPLNPVTPDSPYRKQLENELLRPEMAITAALKLEALGPDSRQPLRVGLQSESPWVRFASAEALAYLGHSDGARDLAELAEKHPSLRSHCLTALASLDDAICLDQLAELMKRPDPQLRYGAFVALRSASEAHEAVRGVRVNDSFWLHHVAADSPPMVHVCTDRRAEVVLFGSLQPLKGPFSFPLGQDFTVAAKGDEPRVTVTKIAIKDGEPVPVSKQCLADVGAVVKTLAELGGTFTEVVEFVRRAETADALAAAVQYDARPRGLSVQQLAQIAGSDPSIERADLEVARAGQADVVPASYDLPTEADRVKAQPTTPAPEPALNRDPGRLFGSKRDVAPSAEK
ncbi:MAG TPA: HEAT repeat domain-containing protein, partial [Fimbriiglobus sp.]|nr:HEAT repeat domain-containing protein [Fimbriiglobus sp.]